MIVISGLTTAVTSGEKTRPAKNGCRTITESKIHMFVVLDAVVLIHHIVIIFLSAGQLLRLDKEVISN